jgi:hypothetical protein
MNQPDPTPAIDVWARMLCAADVHVHGADHPTWQQLVGEPGQRIQDDYRKAAAWLLPRMTVATRPAAVQPAPADQPGRYRNRTAEVEAVQWTGDNADALIAFCGPFDFQMIDPEDRTEDPDATAAFRESAHGTWRELKPGDWVVRRDRDWFEVSAADFANLYEPAALSPPADRASLRDRVAKALYEHSNPGFQWSDAHPHDRLVFGDDADPVLTVLAEPAPAVWIDGHPQLEAIARAVWERCGTDECAVVTIDDPRNIAVAALAAMTPAPDNQATSTAPLAAGLPLVQGNCPACSSASLFLGNGGYVTCSRIDCPEPDAASTALERRLVGEAQQDPAQDNEAVCVCSHTRNQHTTVSGHLICNACDGDSSRPCKEFDAQ